MALNKSKIKKDIKLGQIMPERHAHEESKIELIFSIRQQKQLKQPAQDRLKRLQTQLKRIDAKKVNKETQNNVAKRDSNSSTSTSSSTLQSKKLHSLANCNSARSLRETTLPRLPLPTKQRLTRAVALQASIKDAWAKPKVLLDAEHKVKSDAPRLSVNDRLAKLCTSLQQKQAEPKTMTERPQEQPKTSQTSASVLRKAQQQRRLRRCAQRAAATDDEAEPMDWEEDESETAASERQRAAHDQDEKQQKEQNIMPLLRYLPYDLNDEQLPARLMQHVYFVLDTNVLIHDLSFVEKLTKLVLDGTEGSMLYIPYIVIKELDGLKEKHTKTNGTAGLCAIRAIRYLNKKFDESLAIQAQSAIEEADHLIDVDTPDDSIINCCLQLKPQVFRMQLLTNDKNLRLKAIANGIKATDAPTLIFDHSDAFAAINL